MRQAAITRMVAIPTARSMATLMAIPMAIPTAAMAPTMPEPMAPAAMGRLDLEEAAPSRPRALGKQRTWGSMGISEMSVFSESSVICELRAQCSRHLKRAYNRQGGSSLDVYM